MRLAEEMILLLLNEESGYLEHVGGWNMSCAIAGSVLADLSLEYRIDTDLDSLKLIDSTETGDELLDPVLAEIAAAPPPSQNARYWIEKTAGRAESVIESALNRLVKNNILDHDSGGFRSLTRKVSRSGVYPPTGGVTRQETKSRIFSAVLDAEIPDPRDVILISPVAACDAFRLLLAPEELEQTRERIDPICKMDLLGQAIGAAIKESSAGPAQMYVSHSKPIPKASLSWLIGNRHLRRGDFSRLMTDAYRKYGPVFRMARPFSDKGIVVLTGHDTNTWINRNGRYYFRSRDHMSDFEQLFGASRTLPGMDGAEHYRMRKSLRAGYSRKLLEARLDELYGYCRTSLQEWREGDVLPAAAACQKAMGLQVSRLFVGVDTSDCIGDVLKYEHLSLITHVQKALPQFMINTPAMRKRRRIILDLIASIYGVHTPAQRKNKPRDLVDSILDLHASDPPFFPETVVGFLFVATLIASIYLGSGLSFALYGMAAHPDIYRRVQAEADALFADGDPDRFDIDRYAPPREEHKTTGAYVPFGLGTHRCLGSRLVELQMAVNLLLIAHNFNISVVPSDYEIGFNPFPTAAPNRKLKFRIDERRSEFR